MSRQIRKAHQNARKLNIDKNTKLILFSDLHRGSGSRGDSFAKNQLLYLAALRYYFENDYTYIELGDGDELWKEDKMTSILGAYQQIFRLLSEFHAQKRFIMLYGNHDSIKKDKFWQMENLYRFHLQNEQEMLALFPDICIDEAVLLSYLPKGRKILLLHGHQGDFRSSHFFQMTKMCVRYLWQPLEYLGLKNPFDTGHKESRQSKVEQNLKRYAGKVKLPIIAGHTHRPRFAMAGETPYFNTGSGVHTAYITGIELVCGTLQQVRWTFLLRADGSIYAGKELLQAGRKLEDL